MRRPEPVACRSAFARSSALGDFWNLVEQAGPLRWPIFAVFGVGLALAISKLYELLKDRAQSRELMGADLRSASLKDVTALVARQRDSMLAVLQSTMVNVFQTRPSEGMLHDEITNFVASQQDQFGVFRRRMEFLSDTAGALGLMGTVWGMFEVFFQGSSDKDVILRGMGIALITTLLGLVVSIVLNLSATELSTFFEKRLERIGKKSDELRFRLLELASAAHGQPVAAVAPPSARKEPGRRAEAAAPPPPSAPKHKPAYPPPAQAAAPTPEAAASDWVYLESESAGYVARAGEMLHDLEVRVRRDGGQPVRGVPVVVTLPPNAGALPGGGREFKGDSDAAGSLRFAWQAPTAAGSYHLVAAVPGRPGADRRVDLRVDPGAPHRVQREGNNQAAVAGMKLPQPMGVRVFDKFDNPVAGVAVHFEVKHGQGRLGRHGAEAHLKTDASGLAKTPFAVSSEAGANTVVATVEGEAAGLEFVAFGTEV